MIPEGYAVIVLEKGELTKIIDDNFKESDAIIYNFNRFQYLLDTKAHLVLAEEK